MSSPELGNLVKLGSLTPQKWPSGKLEVLRQRGRAWLQDASNKTNSLDGRFELVYTGTHAFAVAALGAAGYASDNRSIAFQVLEHTTTLDKASIMTLTKAHVLRNLVEYHGAGAITEQFVAELILAGKALERLLPNP